MALPMRAVATFGTDGVETAGLPVTCTLVKIPAGEPDGGVSRVASGGLGGVLLGLPGLVEVGGRGGWRLPVLPTALKAQKGLVGQFSGWW